MEILVRSNLVVQQVKWGTNIIPTRFKILLQCAN